MIDGMVNKDVIKYNPYVDKIYTNYKNSFFKDFDSVGSKFDIELALQFSSELNIINIVFINCARFSSYYL